jgi:molybdopterin-guanine dinucleotide biosynthesis protein A
MLDVEGFILVGGKSRRMGTDKAMLDLGGRKFVQIIAEALCAVAEQPRLVGAAYECSGCNLPNVADVYPEWGALGGLHAALSACSKAWAAVVACDLPFVTGDLFLRLASFRDSVDAVAPLQADGWPQPLCAFYNAGTCGPVAEKLIAAGERRPRALLEDVHTRWVSPEEISDIEGSSLFFTNVNTPEEYEDARERRKPQDQR